jgi:hypothetical protein
MSIPRWCAAICLLGGLLSCGGGSTHNSPGNPAVPQFSHVFIVVEENHSYSQVIGQSTMPYLNSLANRFAVAANYFANTHPSLPNYFVLTTGQSITSDDNFTGSVTADNVVNALKSAGKTWKCYADSIPSPGYNGADTAVFVRRHVPFSFFSDVQGDAAQMGNIVPFSQLSADLTANQLPDYGFIVPNLQDDGHDCPGGGQSCDDGVRLGAADSWLAMNIQPLLNNPAFQQSGLLLITFDEGMDGDNANGGGQVPLLVISSKTKPGFKSTTFYQHQNTLRLILDGLGVTDLPGHAAGATQMGEFFQ